MATLTQAVDAITALENTVSTKIQSIDAAVTQAQADVNGFIAGARKEFGIIRVTENQVMQGTSGSPPTGFTAHPAVTCILEEKVVTNVPWSQRSAIQQEFLTAIGAPGVRYLAPHFNIWRISWDFTNYPNDTWTLFPAPITENDCTVGAVVKLESGAITGHWATGAELGVTKVCGQHHANHALYYINAHPYHGSVQGSLLVALVGAVAGYVEVENGEWGFYNSIYGASDNALWW